MAYAGWFGNEFSLFGIIKRLKVVPILYVTFVGAPSLLAILDHALDLNFTAILSWIFDGYAILRDIIGRLFDPLFHFITLSISRVFAIQVSFSDHWKDVFFLTMIAAAGRIRTTENRSQWPPVFRWAFGITLSWGVAGISGLISNSSGIWAVVAVSLTVGLFLQFLMSLPNAGLLKHLQVLIDRMKARRNKGGLFALPIVFLDEAKEAIDLSTEKHPFENIVWTDISGTWALASISILWTVLFAIMMASVIGMGVSVENSVVLSVAALIALQSIICGRISYLAMDADGTSQSLIMLGGFLVAVLILILNYGIRLVLSI